MSPKSARISLPLLFLTLASLTLSSAADHNGCPRDSIPTLLEHFELPNNVENFSCDETDVNNTDQELLLKIELQQESCTVTRDCFDSVVEFKQVIAAIISRRQLRDIHGVTVRVNAPIVIYPQTMIITRVKVTEYFPNVKILLLFNSADLTQFDPFPINFFPSEPPTCSSSTAAALDYLGSARVVAAKDNQDVPMWIYKYGRLLPLVAA